MSNCDEKQCDGFPRASIVPLLSSHLKDWDVVGAEEAIDQWEYQEWIKENGAFDVIPVIVEYLDEEHEEKCPQLVNTCSLLLQKLAEKCSPKEVLIALIEHCEAFQSDVKYRNILPALSIVFKRLCQNPNGKLGLTLDWALDTLVSHINAMICPDIPSLDNAREWCTIDMMPEIKEILSVVQAFIDFLCPIVLQISNEDNSEISSNERSKCKQLLTWACMEMLAMPLVSMNLLSKGAKDAYGLFRGKSDSRQLADVIVQNILANSSNVVDLIDFDTVKKSLKKDRFSSLQKDEGLRWQCAIGTLFYIIYDDASEPNESKGFIEKLPFCYHPTYLFHLLLPSITCLLEEKQNYLANYKAITLGLLLVERIPIGCISKEELQTEIHSKFLKNLVRTIIYSTSEVVRKDSYMLFEKYYLLFEANFARYRLVIQLLEIANHSGLIGQTIVKIKNSVLQQMNISDEEMPEKQFKGHGLAVLIRKICVLKHGAETDLLEICDELMSSLNLLVCLMSRDKISNQTGIWDLKDEIIKQFVNPLKMAISMSRAHYKLKLNDKPDKNERQNDVSLMVGGQTLPHMKYDKMKEVINAALNTFDMMECVLVQLYGVLGI